MKKALFYNYIIVWILIGAVTVPLYAQESPQLSIAEEFVQLESQLSDSASLERIIDRISDTGSSPRLSLRYIDFYERMIEKYPTIPNRDRWVQILKGYRYNSLAWNNNRSYPDLAFSYIDTAQQLFERHDFGEGSWLNQYGLGVICRHQGDNEQALHHFDNYLEHFSNPLDSALVANVQFQRGVVLLQLGQLDKSAAALTQAARLDEGLGRSRSQANNLNTLANVYKRAGLDGKAEAAYLEALAVYRQAEDQLGQSRILLNYANFKVAQNQSEAAQDLYYQALALSRGNPDLQGFVYGNLGNFYLQEELYDSSLHYLSQSYELRKSFQNPRQLYLTEHKLGRLYLRMDRLNEAYPFLNRSLQTAKQQREQESIRDIANDLSLWYEKRGDFRQALEYKDLYIEAKDSLLDRNIAHQVAELNTQYETEKKEQAISLLSARNEAAQLRINRSQRTLVFVLIALALLALLTLQVYRSRQKVNAMNQRLEKQNQVIEKALREKDVLLREIHHRVKNNLQVISSLLSIQSRNLTDPGAVDALNEGRSRVQTMSLIHQDLYLQDELTGIAIRRYFEQLVHNLFSTYKVAQEEINIKAEIDDLFLDVDTVIPLGLILNELISNALKYAFPDGKGKIEVTLREEEDGLYLEVADNGIGMANITQAQNGDSYGYELIQALVDKLDGELHISNQNGTRVKARLKTYQKAA